MFSTDFIFRQQENLVDNQKCQAGFRPLCNKILLLSAKKEFLPLICYLIHPSSHLHRNNGVVILQFYYKNFDYIKYEMHQETFPDFLCEYN